MGKRIRPRRRGAGSPAYRRPSHRFKVDALIPQENMEGVVTEFIDDPAHSAIFMLVKTNDGRTFPLIAPEGIKQGDRVGIGPNAPMEFGCVKPLGTIPDGFPVYNIEITPYDGGKLVKSAGSNAFVISRDEQSVLVKLPSGALKSFKPECRAQIGVIAGGGREEKPFFKAGNKFYAMRARNMDWPKVRGVKKNIVYHPFGGKQHHRGAASTVSRRAPPGQKVGHLAARRTGRRKRG